MTNTATSEVQEHLRRLVEDVLAGTPHFLVDLSVRGASGSRAVDVYLDSDDVLGVDTLARISREIEFLLDAEDLIPGRYRLTVSTPGVDRPLKDLRQYKKNMGRVLRVHHRKPEGDGNTETLGELTGATDDAIEVRVAGAEALCIRYDDILWAKVQLPW